MAEEKTIGCIVRSRARWYESGEKCNKYFLNLSKRSYNKRHIKKWKSTAGLASPQTSFGVRLSRIHFSTNPKGRLRGGYFVGSGPCSWLGIFSFSIY